MGEQQGSNAYATQSGGSFVPSLFPLRRRPSSVVFCWTYLFDEGDGMGQAHVFQCLQMLIEIAHTGSTGNIQLWKTVARHRETAQISKFS